MNIRGALEWLIVAGGCVFISMLGLSAFWEPAIRWLHFFQAWMYMPAGSCWAFALATGFFALDMALFQPGYLGLFPRMLHPHLP